jgi:hypothetical protein
MRGSTTINRKTIVISLYWPLPLLPCLSWRGQALSLRRVRWASLHLLSPCRLRRGRRRRIPGLGAIGRGR